ncbi:MAG: nucleotide pyrophosphohydrolase [Proteobacteria bacterium]|nr:nucleotide pyrophosphohydrolase [Pseudomonadota bacterium]NDC25607.1 nucleotide pyrophosphohydrolase [Pseudomonadota bacterium]NDD05291.1 nucleotide pyrophosphohydrolase [Pseudomonadota bacterium]NDG26902.1 nucleotide pyrophosphohydrolase [Pseudomonadota bacterium]
MNIELLQKKIREFVQERDWEKYHNPKNLSMALAGEAGELLEIFQWLTPAESSEIKNNPQAYQRTKHEIADILVYLLRLSDKLEIDLEQAVLEKIKLNQEKYPTHLAKGSAKKYTDLK